MVNLPDFADGALLSSATCAEVALEDTDGLAARVGDRCEA
jgi:hypothetical protein